MDYINYYFNTGRSLDWVAIIALVVGIFSLFFSIYFNRKTFRLTETHNKKMVKPWFSYWYRSELENHYSFESFEVKNCGFGPAKITNWKFIYKGNSYDSIIDAYQRHGDYLNYREELSSIVKLNNVVLAPNETSTLFKLYFAKKNLLNGDYYYARLFKEFTKEVSFELNYLNIYDDPGQSKEESLVG